MLHKSYKHCRYDLINISQCNVTHHVTEERKQHRKFFISSHQKNWRENENFFIALKFLFALVPQRGKARKSFDYFLPRETQLQREHLLMEL